MRQVAISFITALLIAAVALAIPALAQSAVEDFYQGKQINVIVGP